MSSLDVSKCKNEKCTLKQDCFRYTSLPKEYWQSYTDFSQDKKGNCEFYKPNKNG